MSEKQEKRTAKRSQKFEDDADARWTKSMKF
jgi:hypothetical protein